MSKIRLGGIKVVEKRACLYSSCQRGADLLGDICSILAAGRINMGLLTHVADNGFGESITAASANSASCFSGYMLRVAGSGKCKTVEIESDISRISVFPHDQRPEIAASMITILDAAAIQPYGFCSSPSAVTVIVSSADFQMAMERLFDSFAFPACGTYSEWQAVCRMDEQQLSDVRCSYSEQIITIYGFTRQTGLDLWNVSLPIEYMSGFGAFLSELGELGFKLPFLISNSAPGARGIHFSFALGEDRRDRVGQAFDKHLPGRDRFCLGPISVLFLHGPHFGDRYGIGDAFVTTLRNAGIPILALSCTVSSISAVIAGNDLDKAIEVLNTRFQTPGGNRR
jgi:aspartokinase